MSHPFTEVDRSRFEKFFEKKNEDECWLWTGFTRTGAGYGYGSFSYGPKKARKRMMANRVSYLLYVGAIPEGQLVCHKCDTPACVNPKHLFLGTHQENMDDMKSKGRSPVSITRSKLSWEDVDAIRASNESGIVLARRYNVAKSTISEIRKGHIWKEHHREAAKVA